MRPIDANLLKAEFTGNFAKAYSPAQIKALIDTAPEIDPVHAAGGVYCRECECFDDHAPGVVFDGYCLRLDKAIFGSDFCTWGAKREDEDDGL